MKTVYLDMVLLVNFCADYILLYMCSSLLHIKASLSRIVSAAALGAIYGAAAVIVPGTGILFLPVMLLMCYVSFGKRKILTYIRILLVVFIFSLLLGGITEMLTEAFTEKKNMHFGIVALILGLFALIVLVVCSQRLLNSQLNTQVVDAHICVGNEAFDTALLSDTGNLLRDPESGKCIIILDSAYRRVFMNNADAVNVAVFKTVSGNGIVEFYKADAVTVNDIQIDAYVGFCINGLCSFDGYDGIIPAGVVRNL